ncbi:MAG: amino acid permease [Saprospiraceae bacterium]|nr:amino acid permease [Saprospiraceae bacterium]
MSLLQKRITLYGLTMIAIGSSIGSGIFVTPGTIAREIPHPYLILMVWLLGGLMGLTGALTFAELGGLFTRAGGVYVYLKHAYGNLAGFLYGWVMLVVINTGSLAGLCVAFAEYLRFFIPEISGPLKMGISAATLIILTAINILGVHYSQHLSNILTTIKVAAIAIIVLIGLFAGDADAIQQNFNTAHALPANLFVALFSGMIGVFFSVGGWHHATYVAGEVINPEKNVARAMVLGTTIITIAYVTINLAYMRLLPVDIIEQTQTVASDAVSRVIPWGGRLVAIGIALSIFGTISIYTMSAPRIYYAMAEDGLFFKSMAKVHVRWRTPVTAMLIQALWALCVLFFFQAYFDKIITFVTFMDALFFALAAAAVFVFRHTLKDHPRVYSVWGYPFIPLIFISLQTVFAINIFFQKPQQALPGLGLMILGIGVYYWFKRQLKS